MYQSDGRAPLVDPSRGILKAPKSNLEESMGASGLEWGGVLVVA